jgi:hypothetical protein
MVTNGRKTIASAGQPEPLAPPGISGLVLIQALPSNTSYVALGGKPNEYLPNCLERTTGPSVGTPSGWLLQALEALPVAVEISQVWVDAGTDGDGVTWMMV